MPTYKIKIEYDGTSFCGWQRQKGHPSVQEEIEKALSVYFRQPITIQGAGRTDTGVHALGQVASFTASKEVDLGKMLWGVNAIMRPQAICLLDAEIMNDDFNARFCAQKRCYEYRILNRTTPSPLLKNRVWWVNIKMDIPLMQKCADMLIGKHDFSTFRSSECQAKSPIKTLDSFVIKKDGDLIIFEVCAKSFLHHQVRNMVGSLYKVGIGQWTADDFKRAFEACDRCKGGPTAPAEGLYFMDVEYD